MEKKPEEKNDFKYAIDAVKWDRTAKKLAGFCCIVVGLLICSAQTKGQGFLQVIGDLRSINFEFGTLAGMAAVGYGVYLIRKSQFNVTYQGPTGDRSKFEIREPPLEKFRHDL